MRAIDRGRGGECIDFTFVTIGLELVELSQVEVGENLRY